MVAPVPSSRSGSQSSSCGRAGGNSRCEDFRPGAVSANQLAKTAAQAIGWCVNLEWGSVLSEGKLARAAKECSYATEGGDANERWNYRGGLQRPDCFWRGVFAAAGYGQGCGVEKQSHRAQSG